MQSKLSMLGHLIVLDAIKPKASKNTWKIHRQVMYTAFACGISIHIMHINATLQYCIHVHVYLMTSSETKCCLDMRICLISILTTLDDSLSCTGREDCREGGRDIEHMHI